MFPNVIDSIAVAMYDCMISNTGYDNIGNVFYVVVYFQMQGATLWVSP